jgi:uncharacterized protein (UPF0297 family)
MRFMPLPAIISKDINNNMSDRAKEFMKLVWDKRDNGADTEEKLVGSILSIIPSYVRSYTAQNNITVLDTSDLIELSQEVSNLQND